MIRSPGFGRDRKRTKRTFPEQIGNSRYSEYIINDGFLYSQLWPSYLLVKAAFKNDGWIGFQTKEHGNFIVGIAANKPFVEIASERYVAENRYAANPISFAIFANQLIVEADKNIVIDLFPMMLQRLIYSEPPQDFNIYLEE